MSEQDVNETTPRQKAGKRAAQTKRDRIAEKIEAARAASWYAGWNEGVIEARKERKGRAGFFAGMFTGAVSMLAAGWIGSMLTAWLAS